VANLPSRHRRAPLVWFVLCAFFVHGLIPQGFMPGSIAAGKPVVICYGGFYKAVQIDARGKIVDGKSTEHARKLCEFAAAPFAFTPPAILSLRAVGSIDSFACARVFANVVLSIFEHGHSARGPPEFSSPS